MTYQQPAPPPPVDPAALRPGRIWYLIAGIVVVLGVCIGPGLAVIGFRSLAGALPEMRQEFAAGTPTTVDLTSAQDSAIYVHNPGRSGEGTAPAPDIDCTGEGRGITLTRSDTNLEFDSGNRHWQLVYDISVDRDGSYRITCESTDPNLPEPTLAIGDAVNVGGLAGTVFGALGALLGIPCVTLVTGGVIALVTAVRRNSHKKRLEEARGVGGAPPGYPGAELGVPPPAPPPGTAPPGAPPPTPPPAPPPGTAPPGAPPSTPPGPTGQPPGAAPPGQPGQPPGTAPPGQPPAGQPPAGQPPAEPGEPGPPAPGPPPAGPPPAEPPAPGPPPAPPAAEPPDAPAPPPGEPPPGEPPPEEPPPEEPPPETPPSGPSTGPRP